MKEISIKWSTEDVFIKLNKMKIKTSIKKDGFKLTILPTIQYYYAYRIVVIVWLNYELQFHIR